MVDKVGFLKGEAVPFTSSQLELMFLIEDVLGVSTSTRFVTGCVNLDFCEGYMKDKFLF